MALKIAAAPSPLNTLLENIPVLSEALLIFTDSKRPWPAWAWVAGFVRLLLLVPSARLATSVERKGEARQGAG